MPKKLIKIDGSQATAEERIERKRFVDRIRMQINRGQLDGDLYDYVDKYDEEHGYTIKEYDFQDIIHKRTTIKPEATSQEVTRSVSKEEDKYGEYVLSPKLETESERTEYIDEDDKDVNISKQKSLDVVNIIIDSGKQAVEGWKYILGIKKPVLEEEGWETL